MECDNPFLTNEYHGMGYHVCFFYFFWGGRLRFVCKLSGSTRWRYVRGSEPWAKNNPTCCEGNGLVIVTVLFLLGGRDLNRIGSLSLDEKGHPPTCRREKQVIFLEISFLVKSDYSNDSQPQPFLCPFFFLVTKAWRFCGAWDGDLLGNRYDNFEGLSMTIKSALNVGN